MELLKTHFHDASETHVWKVLLSQQETASGHLERLLSREERQRSGQFRFDHLRRRYIHTHCALRMILGDYCDQPPETLHFGRGRYGKPFLVNPRTPIAFNLSHCEDMSLIAVSAGSAIGVDVERVRHLQYLDSILNRFFNAEEREYIRSAPGGEQVRAFFTLWTRREAAVKALGLNLQAALTQIRIPLFPSQGSIVVSGIGGVEAMDTKPISSWSVQDLNLDTTHRGAVCVEGKKCTISVRDFK